MAITCVEPTYVARKKTKIVKRKKKSALLSLHCVSSCALVCVRERARERERERESEEGRGRGTLGRDGGIGGATAAAGQGNATRVGLGVGGSRYRNGLHLVLQPEAYK